MKILKLVSFLLFLLIPAFLFANEQEFEKNKAKDFFDQDFVVKKRIQKDVDDKTGFVEFSEVTPTPKINEQNLKEDLPEKLERKIIYIKAIINADNFEHFKKEKENIEDFCLNTDIQLINLYAICHNCDTDKINNLTNGFHSWILGGNFGIYKNIPEKYSKIEVSPSYVIGLQNGEIVLEGKELLTKYINEKGFYLGQLSLEK